MFDPKAYRDMVVQPLQKNTAQQAAVAEALRGINDSKTDAALLEALTTRVDVAALFGITPGMSDVELAQHLKSVEMFLNKGMPAVSKTLAQLLKAIKAKANGYSTSRFWDGLSSAAAAVGQQRLRQFGVAVKQQEILGVITPNRLRKTASAYGLPNSVSDKELAKAVAAQGVEVCSDFEAPKVSVSSAPLKKDLHPAFRTIVDVLLLHDRSSRPTGIQVIGNLSYEAGGTRRTITLVDLDKSKSAANTKSDDATESAKKTLNAIVGQCNNDNDLHRLVLAWFLDLADDLVRKQGLMLFPALEKLAERGLVDLDAKRILAKATAAGSGPDLNNVRELIASGELQSAHRLMASLVDGQDASGDQSPLLKAVTAALADAERKKQEALKAYREAVKVQDYGAAQQALSQARIMDREDSDVARLLEQLPPATPTNLQAVYSAQVGGVALTWRGIQNPDVRYAVVRGETGVPANPKAGQQIVAATSEPRAVDSSPPVARKITYAVFAFRQGTEYSLPATVQFMVVPPPSGVEAAVTTKDVTVFWRTPPQSSGVSVELVEPGGIKKAFPPSTKDKLLIDGLTIGEKYTLVLVAHYVASGQRVVSEPVSVDATPRGTVQAVNDLEIGNTTMPNGRAGMRAEWGEILGYPVDLWSLPIDVTLALGSRVSVAGLEDLAGKRLVGSVRSSGAKQTMDFYSFQDIRVVLPVTWDGAEGVVGAAVVAGTAPPPKSLEAIRYGSELVVSWVWPHGDYRMDVAWAFQDGRTGQQRIDRLAYNRNGGIRIDDADAVIKVTVGTVATGGSQDYVFSPVAIQVAAAAPTLSYELRLPRGLFGSRRAEVEVTSRSHRGAAELVAVLAPGNFMPARASDGQEIARFTLDFSGSATHHATFNIPKIKSPFWVRIFPAVEGQFAIKDPMTASMKG